MLTPIVAIAPDDASQSYDAVLSAQSIPEGQTAKLSLAVKKLDGTTAKSLVGCSLLLTVVDADGAQVFAPKTATIDDAANGLASFSFVPADTLDKRGAYTYDVWLIDATSEHFQIVGVSSFVIRASRGRP